MYSKTGVYRVYIIFLISAQNIDCGIRKNRLVEAVLTSNTIYVLNEAVRTSSTIYVLSSQRGGSNEYHNLCFEQTYEKYQSFLSENFQFLEVKSQYIWIGEFP